MAISHPNITDTSGEWIDLVAENGALANTAIIVQNRRADKILIYWGGASAPAGDYGLALGEDEYSAATSDHVWVKPLTGSGFTVAVTIGDA